MVKVKICGISNLADARMALSAGADALGFNFYRRSPRYIDALKAARIIRSLPDSILKIGVFVDEGRESILRIFRICRLGMVQLHGRETPKGTAELGVPAIKSFRVRSRADVDGAAEYRGCAYLFDGYDASAPGGTGRKFKWAWLAKSAPPAPYFLAGGLNPGNVKAAIRQARPFAVDVCGGVERAPGLKDGDKVRRFVRMAKGSR